MPKYTPSARLVAAILASGALTGGAAGAAQAAGDVRGREARTATDLVRGSSARFTQPTRITTPWLPLSVHREAVFVGQSGTGSDLRVLQTVLTHTKAFMVDGRLVRTLPVEQRSFEDGTLREVSVAYHAQTDDGAVYELGRDVYRADRADHRGSAVLTDRRAERGLRLAMPAVPRDGALVGDGGQRVVDTNARLTVTRGTFNRVLVINTAASADEPSAVRYYARGVGLVKARTAAGGLELASLR